MVSAIQALLFKPASAQSLLFYVSGIITQRFVLELYAQYSPVAVIDIHTYLLYYPYPG